MGGRGRPSKFSGQVLESIWKNWYLEGKTATSCAREFGYHSAYHKDIMRKAIKDEKIPMNREQYEYRVKMGKKMGGQNRWLDTYDDNGIGGENYVGEIGEKVYLDSHGGGTEMPKYRPSGSNQMYSPGEIEKYTKEDSEGKTIYSGIGYSS